MEDGQAEHDDVMDTAAHAVFHGDSSASSSSVRSVGTSLHLPRVISNTGVSKPHGKRPASLPADYVQEER